MNFRAEISPLHADDTNRAVEVWEASVRATHSFVTEEDIEVFRPLVRGAFPDALTFGCIRDEAGQIVGFVGMSDSKIEMLFVHPDWRGRGVGRLLLGYAVRELKATMVDVNEQNGQAVGFYQRTGFETIGRSEYDGLGKPYPLLHMQLRECKEAS